MLITSRRSDHLLKNTGKWVLHGFIKPFLRKFWRDFERKLHVFTAPCERFLRPLFKKQKSYTCLKAFLTKIWRRRRFSEILSDKRNFVLYSRPLSHVFHGLFHTFFTASFTCFSRPLLNIFKAFLTNIWRRRRLPEFCPIFKRIFVFFTEKRLQNGTK